MEPLWTLTLDLTLYTPAEVEVMTELSTAMQRDWRFKGFGPVPEKVREKHSRMTMFDVAELYFMKVFSDQGKGPSQTAPYARRFAERIVATAMMWRGEAWAGEAPEEMFDRIPRQTRFLTFGEAADAAAGDLVKWGPDRPEEVYYRRQWVAWQMSLALGLEGWQRTGGQVIWWPTGEVVAGNYESLRFQGIGGDNKMSRVDPKFNGPALVFDIEAAAEILVDRSPRPWVTGSLAIDPEKPAPQNFQVQRNQGDVIVTAGEKRASLDAMFPRWLSNE